MEGEGPVKGNPIASGVALAGTDALSVDLLGAELMGLDPRMIGYLWYLSQLRGLTRGQIEVRGAVPHECVTRFELPSTFPNILGWYVPEWQRYLSGQYLEAHGTGPQGTMDAAH
jgi:uncharacterized protein (DUF362 family)